MSEIEPLSRLVANFDNTATKIECPESKRHKPEIPVRTLIAHCVSAHRLFRFGKQRNWGTEKKRRPKRNVH